MLQGLDHHAAELEALQPQGSAKLDTANAASAALLLDSWMAFRRDHAGALVAAARACKAHTADTQLTGEQQMLAASIHAVYSAIEGNRPWLQQAAAAAAAAAAASAPAATAADSEGAPPSLPASVQAPFQVRLYLYTCLPVCCHHGLLCVRDSQDRTHASIPKAAQCSPASLLYRQSAMSRAHVGGVPQEADNALCIVCCVSTFVAAFTVQRRGARHQPGRRGGFHSYCTHRQRA
jgi:hypothetical protein